MRTSLGELADYYDAESQVVKAFRAPVPKPKPPKVSPDLIRQRVARPKGLPTPPKMPRLKPPSLEAP